MTKILMAVLVSLVGFAAQAHDVGAFNTGPVQSCADARLMQDFSTYGEAANYCSRLRSYFVQVGVTNDLSGSFTCSCNGGGYNNN